MKKLILAALIFTHSLACMADIAVVTHKGSSIESLDKKSLIDIYMGRAKTFHNGIFARPVDQRQASPMRQEFYEEITGKRLAQVNAYWARLKFTGRHQPPIDSFETDAEILQYVEDTPGAIAYIDASNAVDNINVVYIIKTE